NPVRAGGIDVQDKKRIGFGVVRPKWGNMRTAPFAHSLAQERHNYVIASTFEVLNQLGPNVLLYLVVVNYGQLRGYSIRSQHFIELPDLIAEVGDRFSVDR